MTGLETSTTASKANINNFSVLMSASDSSSSRGSKKGEESVSEGASPSAGASPVKQAFSGKMSFAAASATIPQPSAPPAKANHSSTSKNTASGEIDAGWVKTDSRKTWRGSSAAILERSRASMARMSLRENNENNNNPTPSTAPSDKTNNNATFSAPRRQFNTSTGGKSGAQPNANNAVRRPDQSTTNPNQSRHFSQNLPMLPERSFELYDFSPELKTEDLHAFVRAALPSAEGHYRLKWQNDTSCWCICESDSLCQLLLSVLLTPIEEENSKIHVRPYAQENVQLKPKEQQPSSVSQVTGQ